LFRVRPGVQDSGYQVLGFGADPSGPTDEAGGSPFEIPLMSLRHVFREGGRFPRAIGPEMGGDSSALEEDLDGGIG